MAYQIYRYHIIRARRFGLRHVSLEEHWPYLLRNLTGVHEKRWSRNNYLHENSISRSYVYYRLTSFTVRAAICSDINWSSLSCFFPKHSHYMIRYYNPPEEQALIILSSPCMVSSYASTMSQILISSGHYSCGSQICSRMHFKIVGS